MLIKSIYEGKISTKDIPGFNPSTGTISGGKLRNMADRSFAVANSHISFEELSGSHRADGESLRSTGPQQLQNYAGSSNLN